MRIGINFHSADKYISGVEYYTLGMINALLRVDSQNEYIVFTNQPDLVKQYMPASKHLQIRPVRLMKTRGRRIVWEHFRLPQLAARARLDILHCPVYICPLLDVGIPYVVTVHDTIAINYPKWCKFSNALYFNMVMKAAAKRAAAIVTVSERTADDLKEVSPSYAAKIHVVHPGIDTIFNAEADVSQLPKVRARYGLPDRYILYVGNIEPKKNLRTLLDAHKILRAKGLPQKLVIVGKRHWKARSVLRSMLKGNSLGDITLTGYAERHDLPYIYQMADVFVFISWYEGFGFPPLEAMACGTPVIASARGALKETLADAAYTVPPDSPEEIAEAISRMVTDRSLREKYVRIGKVRSDMFPWEKSARKLLSIYSTVVANNGKKQ